MSLVTSTSPHTVSATIERLLAALERRDIELFARVDHGGGARAAGLELPDEEVLIFGNPRAGTPLMQSDPRVGYELPLRLLVWDAAGQTMVGYRPPTELGAEYRLGDHVDALKGMAALLGQIAAEGTAPADA